MIDSHPIEHMPGKIEFIEMQRTQILLDVPLPIKEQPIPSLQWFFLQIQTWVLLEMRRAQQFAIGCIRPAMYRTDNIADIAAPLKQQRLPVTTDIRQQLDTMLVVHQYACIISALQYVIVTLFRDHQFVASITWPLIKKQSFF